MIALGAGLLVLSHTQSLVAFYTAFIIISFGAGGCTSVVTMTVIANWFQKNLGKAIGVMASGFGFSGFMVPVIVWLVDTYQWRNAVYILGLGIWGFYYVNAWWGVLFFLLLFPPGLGGSMVLRGAVLREYFGRYALGKIIGIVMGSASIGGVLGPTLAGWAYDTTGNYHNVWLLFIGLMIVAILLGLQIKPIVNQKMISIT